MAKSAFWESYLSTSVNNRFVHERLGLYEKAFGDHKENISNMIHSLSPNSIAVLGAGFLNDLPIDDLLAQGRKVYLVDWADNASTFGMARSIVSKDINDCYSCLFCKKGTGKEYCRNFTGEFIADGVCTVFESVEEPYVTCKNYEPAVEPSFIKADITAGVARSFAEKIEKRMASCKTAKDAFLTAIAIADNYHHTPIPVENNSMELVTSSMVLSQFDFEPYTYFSTLLQKRFGRDELERHESKLLPLMEKLRTKLFTLQVDAHVKEIYRIVKKDDQARVYVSAELFSSHSGSDKFFLVQDMPKALEALGKYFFFEFGELLEGKVLRKAEIGEGVSINQNYMLIPKTEVGP
jgi:hypothetical protein